MSIAAYQLDFVIPGILPEDAMSLNAILDIFNLRYTPWGLPEISQRFLILIFEEFFGSLFNLSWASNLSDNSSFLLLIIFLIPNFIFASDEADDRKVSELSIDELKQIVRMIVEESIEQCTVTGTMEGRAKVNLKVEGEVVAKMSCEFESKK